jgi:hypothetical protein
MCSSRSAIPASPVWQREAEGLLGDPSALVRAMAVWRSAPASSRSRLRAVALRNMRHTKQMTRSPTNAEGHDMHLFCFGLDIRRKALARRLKRQGWTVSGQAVMAATTRSLFDGSIACPRKCVLKASPIFLSSVPPGETGDPVLQSVMPMGL